MCLCPKKIMNCKRNKFQKFSVISLNNWAWHFEHFDHWMNAHKYTRRSAPASLQRLKHSEKQSILVYCTFVCCVWILSSIKWRIDQSVGNIMIRFGVCSAHKHNRKPEQANKQTSRKDEPKKLRKIETNINYVAFKSDECRNTQENEKESTEQMNGDKQCWSSEIMCIMCAFWTRYNEQRTKHNDLLIFGPAGSKWSAHTTVKQHNGIVDRNRSAIDASAHPCNVHPATQRITVCCSSSLFGLLFISIGIEHLNQYIHVVLARQQ